MKRWLSRAAKIAFLTALVVGISACSVLRGEESEEPDPKTQFLAQANAICAEANQRIRALGQPSGSIRKQAAMAREVNEITRATIDRVDALAAPNGDALLLAGIYERARKALRLADRSTHAIEKGNVAAANRAASKAFRLLSAVNQQLADYGLTECAK